MSRSFKLLASALLAAAVLALSACATGPTVRTDRDPTADFARYQTWSFYKPISMEQAGYTSWVSDRIREDVRREMEARGYRFVPEGGDLLVNFQTRQRERSQVWNVPRVDFGWAYSYRYHAFVSVPIRYDEPQVSRYREGVLTVDLVDGKRNRLVWTGSASAAEVSKRTPEQKMADIDQAVSAIFAKYPGRAGG